MVLMTARDCKVLALLNFLSVYKLNLLLFFPFSPSQKSKPLARRETFMESLRRRDTSSFTSSKNAAAAVVADFFLSGEDKFNLMSLNGGEMAEIGSWEFKTIAQINAWKSTGEE